MSRTLMYFISKKHIKKQSKKAIKYMKGSVLEPTFIKTFDGKNMIFLKVCHYIFDIYGLNLFVNDMFSIYEALTNGTELPKAPKKFEDMLKKDLEVKYDPETKKTRSRSPLSTGGNLTATDSVRAVGMFLPT